jgi:hypothetical protein
MKKIILTTLTMMSLSAMAQNVMSPDPMETRTCECLGISKDSKNVVYKATPSIEENKSNSKFYVIPVNGGSPTEVQETDLLKDKTFPLTESILSILKR